MKPDVVTEVVTNKDGEAKAIEKWILGQPATIMDGIGCKHYFEMYTTTSSYCIHCNMGVFRPAKDGKLTG